MEATNQDEAIHTATVQAELDELHALCSQACSDGLFQQLAEAIRRQSGGEDEVEVALVDADPPTFMLVELRSGDDIHLVEIDLTPLTDTHLELQFALTSPSAGWLSKAAVVLSGGQTLSAALADDLAAFKRKVEVEEKVPEATVDLVPRTA